MVRQPAETGMFAPFREPQTAILRFCNRAHLGEGNQVPLTSVFMASRNHLNTSRHDPDDTEGQATITAWSRLEDKRRRASA